MSRPRPSKNKIPFLLLFGIGVLNFITQDDLNAVVWMSIACGALTTDILEHRNIEGKLRLALTTLEVISIGVACLFTAFLIMQRKSLG